MSDVGWKSVSDVPAPLWIESDETLAMAMQDVGPVAAIDTEFQRTDTFFPLAGLYQICSGDKVWLLDPLAIKDFSPFVRVLEDPAITKIMHACMEDLELLWHCLGTHPRNIFDTQLAYAYVSTRYSIGLVGLIGTELGIALQQSHTRSDWLRRPLSSGQLHYAAEDVWYLPALYQRLVSRLEETGRLSWFVEDMKLHGVYEPEDPEVYFQSVHRAWSLEAPALGRLQGLCAWRERAAREVNIPRRRVVPDEGLFELARRNQISPRDLEDVMNPGTARRFGAEIIRVHTQSSPVVEPLELPLTPGEGKRIKRLREVAVTQAERLKLAPELIARKRDLEGLFRHWREVGALSPVYSGWRREAVGEHLLAELGPA